MNDPQPDNIDGEKVSKHVYKHSINWSHLAVAVTVIYAIVTLRGMVKDGGGGGDDGGDVISMEDSASVDLDGEGLISGAGDGGD